VDPSLQVRWALASVLVATLAATPKNSQLAELELRPKLRQANAHRREQAQSAHEENEKED